MKIGYPDEVKLEETCDVELCKKVNETAKKIKAKLVRRPSQKED